MRNLLIVEDNYIMKLFLVNYFNTEFHVEAVDKPHQALGRIQQEQYDLVLMDNHQENSQDELDLQKLVEVLRKQGIANILLTDSEKSDERIRAFRMGVEDTISKPFNPVELELRVKCRSGMLSEQIKNVA